MLIPFVLALFSSVALGRGSIRDPELVFNSDHFTRLESCLLDEIVEQSPDHLSRLMPGGSIGHPNNNAGQPIRNLAEMFAAGITVDGRRVGYRVRFATGDGSDWYYFQVGQLYGVYASSMDDTLEVLDYQNGGHLFSVAAEECGND